MRILLATDGSDNAKAAVEWLARWPPPPDSLIRVVTVVHRVIPVAGIDYAGIYASWEALEEAREAELKAAQSIVDEAANYLAEHGFQVEKMVVEGDPGHELIEMAKEWKADAIVAGARGLSTIEALIIGSVTGKLVRHAPCSVIVVKRTKP